MNPDNKIMVFLSKLGDFFILNILYLISCIPVVTIGAATTALYYTVLKMAENRESYVWQDYKKSFKENFKQSTIIWMFLFIIGAVLAGDVLLIQGMSQQLGSMVAVVAIVAAVFLVLTGVYVFPVLARFDNTVPNTLKNALMMSIRHLPSTIMILLIHGLPLLLAFVSLEVFIKGVWVMLLFTVSILAYMEAKFFTRIFTNYYPKEEHYEFANYKRGGLAAWRNRQK